MRARLIALGAAACLGSATSADAFCGFYVGGAGAEMFNNATEVVLMRHGTTTVLSMQNNYQGPPEHFALVVPVPVVVTKEQVRTLPRDVFKKVDVLGAPRLVEYWEQDPCRRDVEEDEDGADKDYARPEKKKKSKSDDDDEKPREYHVKIEAQFSVGEYDIVVLSATQSTGLERWLHDNNYSIPAGAAPLLRPYIEQGTKFFVAKVDPKKVRFVNGMATLSPLRFHYDSPELTLPIRLGLANSQGMQDLIVNILAPNDTRYEVANYPNVTIPTNLTVTDAVRTRFGEFYAALFDHTVAAVPGAVVTEYSWSASNCDPCPGPTLDPSDILTLGGDVIGSSYRDVGRRGGYTLTRLHARYSKDVANDLVFRAVDPIEGGRGIPAPNGAMSTKVEHTGTNNFQGRYAILHPWTGPASCPAPQRGVWGGPNQRSVIAKPATDLAFAPRGNAPLSTFVAGDVGSITATSSNGKSLPIPVRQPQSCGCASHGGAASAMSIVVLGLVLRRRRRI
jgi:uncharacterized protein (TIGR03382 family)